MSEDAATLAKLLATWLPDQRWFAHKGIASLEVELAGEVDLGEVAGGTSRIHLVRAAGALYQVPLSYHPEPVPELAHAAVGVVNLDGGAGGRHARWAYDGTHDPQFVQTLLRLIARGGSAGPSEVVGGVGGVKVQGVVQPGGPLIDEAASSQVLAGEQSNTSIIVGADTPVALIVKLFRTVSAGDNPDVLVQSALAAAGCSRVPQPAGWLEGDWFDPDRSDREGPAHGHLAFASEFLGGSEDAWRVATRAVATGAAFDAPARDLGIATAEVHEVLAARLPIRAATPEVLGALADSLVRRVGWAAQNAPALAEFADQARAVVDGVRRVVNPPALQQVHGDYHLGQVLHAPGRGWVLLDFEGEPLRPLAERLEPDLALRDVAGMLRSFDYAARHATVGLAEDDPAVADAQAWAGRAREAFLSGYAERSGRDLAADADLLAALELDKALYEVVYETRNRPAWVPIPLGAVQRLLPTQPEHVTRHTRPD